MIIESVMRLLTELSLLKKDEQIEERRRIEQEKAEAAERRKARLWAEERRDVLADLRAAEWD